MVRQHAKACFQYTRWSTKCDAKTMQNLFKPKGVNQAFLQRARGTNLDLPPNTIRCTTKPPPPPALQVAVVPSGAGCRDGTLTCLTPGTMCASGTSASLVSSMPTHAAIDMHVWQLERLRPRQADRG